MILSNTESLSVSSRTS